MPRLSTHFNMSYAMVIENNQVVEWVSLNGIVNNWNMG